MIRRSLPRTGSSRYALRVASLRLYSVVPRPRHRAPGVDTRGAATQPRRPLLTTSSAKAEPLDQGPVAVDVLLRQVVQQPAALTDQQQQATTAVVVVLVLLQVLRQVRNA